MKLKKGDRVKILIKSYQKDHADYIEYGIVSGFQFMDRQQKSYSLPDIVSVKKNKFGDEADYCLDTGHQFVWGQGMTGTTEWERLDPEYLPVEPDLETPQWLQSLVEADKDAIDDLPPAGRPNEKSLWQKIKNYISGA